MGHGSLGTLIQSPVGLAIRGDGSFWHFLRPVSLGAVLLKRSCIRRILVVAEREAHAGWSRELSHKNGLPGVLFGGGLAGLGVLVVDTLSLRTGNLGVVSTEYATGVSGCGDSSWNRKLEAYVSTSYSKTF